MSVDPDETFLTVAEVAELLKVNQQTVRNWIDHGRLPALRVGRRVRIRRSDLDRILEAGYRGGNASSSGRPPGPNAEDFWSGEPVGMAEPDPAAPLPPAAPTEATDEPTDETTPAETPRATP